jgi:glycosyltransferase involved in cell wall biosynthesis
MDRHRIGIVIPALNEARTITSVVTSALRYGVPIVVDDASTDKTGELALAAGATVVRHEVNRGYDQTLNSGFARADELACEFIITMDGDGQHDPTLLQRFIQALDDSAAVVVGVRDRFQRVAERMFSWVARARWSLRDPLCGMKGYRMEVYRALGHFDSYGSIGTELAIFAATRGYRIVEIPVRTRERVGVPRFGRLLLGNWRILRALLLSQVRVPRIARR